MSKYYSSSIAFGAEQTKTEKVVVNQNKIGNVTTDAVSGALTVDEVPVKDSLNPVSSDGVARAVIQAGAELPTRGSTDTGKVLKVANSDGDLEWANDNMVTVDQSYNAASTNAQSGTAVAEALGTETTLVAGSGISLTESSGTLTIAASADQTYDATSTNAQSGTAVAEAIAAIPSSSYTAGDAIDITNNEISVDYDMNTLDVAAQTVTDSVTTGDDIFGLPSSIQSFITQNTPVQVTVHIPGNMLGAGGRTDFRFALLSSTDYPWKVAYLPSSLAYEEVDGEIFISEQDITFELPVTVANHWSQQLLSAVAFSISDDDGSIAIGGAFGDLQSDPITFTYAVSTPKLTVKNPLPTSVQADSGKVLKVNASGNAEWSTDGFTTTAGITDIQKVAALPANPVATMLYLIPET